MSEAEQIAARGIRFGSFGWLSDQQAAAIAEDVVASLREAGMLREGPDVGDMLDTLLAVDGGEVTFGVSENGPFAYVCPDGVMWYQPWREALTAAYEALHEARNEGSEPMSLAEDQ